MKVTIREKASRVSVTVGDPVLRKTFLNEVSWARNLNINP